MENIWPRRDDDVCVSESVRVENPWTIICTNSPKNNERPLPVGKLCLGSALSVRQQQQRAADKRSLASFVVQHTSSRQPLLLSCCVASHGGEAVCTCPPSCG